jgi:hypothetical protein
MGFDPCSCFMKIRESIGTLTLKMEAHLGVWGFISSHFSTFLGTWDVIPELFFWPTPLQALALVTNLKLGLRQLKSMIEMQQQQKNQGNFSFSWVCTKCPSNLVGVTNVELIMPKPWLLGAVNFGRCSLGWLIKPKDGSPWQVSTQGTLCVG